MYCLMLLGVVFKESVVCSFLAGIVYRMGDKRFGSYEAKPKSFSALKLTVTVFIEIWSHGIIIYYLGLILPSERIQRLTENHLTFWRQQRAKLFLVYFTYAIIMTCYERRQFINFFSVILMNMQYLFMLTCKS